MKQERQKTRINSDRATVSSYVLPPATALREVAAVLRSSDKKMDDAYRSPSSASSSSSVSTTAAAAADSRRIRIIHRLVCQELAEMRRITDILREAGAAAVDVVAVEEEDGDDDDRGGDSGGDGDGDYDGKQQAAGVAASSLYPPPPQTSASSVVAVSGSIIYTGMMQCHIIELVVVNGPVVEEAEESEISSSANTSSGTKTSSRRSSTRYAVWLPEGYGQTALLAQLQMRQRPADGPSGASGSGSGSPSSGSAGSNSSSSSGSSSQQLYEAVRYRGNFRYGCRHSAVLSITRDDDEIETNTTDGSLGGGDSQVVQQQQQHWGMLTIYTGVGCGGGGGGNSRSSHKSLTTAAGTAVYTMLESYVVSTLWHWDRPVVVSGAGAADADTVRYDDNTTTCGDVDDDDGSDGDGGDHHHPADNGPSRSDGGDPRNSRNPDDDPSTSGHGEPSTSSSLPGNSSSSNSSSSSSSSMAVMWGGGSEPAAVFVTTRQCGVVDDTDTTSATTTGGGGKNQLPPTNNNRAPPSPRQLPPVWAYCGLVRLVGGGGGGAVAVDDDGHNKQQRFPFSFPFLGLEWAQRCGFVPCGLGEYVASTTVVTSPQYQHQHHQSSSFPSFPPFLSALREQQRQLHQELRGLRFCGEWYCGGGGASAEEHSSSVRRPVVGGDAVEGEGEASSTPPLLPPPVGRRGYGVLAANSGPNTLSNTNDHVMSHLMASSGQPPGGGGMMGTGTGMGMSAAVTGARGFNSSSSSSHLQLSGHNHRLYAGEFDGVGVTGELVGRGHDSTSGGGGGGKGVGKGLLGLHRGGTGTVFDDGRGLMMDGVWGAPPPPPAALTPPKILSPTKNVHQQQPQSFNSNSTAADGGMIEMSSIGAGTDHRGGVGGGASSHQQQQGIRLGEPATLHFTQRSFPFVTPFSVDATTSTAATTNTSAQQQAVAAAAAASSEPEFLQRMNNVVRKNNLSSSDLLEKSPGNHHKQHNNQRYLYTTLELLLPQQALSSKLGGSQQQRATTTSSMTTRAKIPSAIKHETSTADDTTSGTAARQAVAESSTNEVALRSATIASESPAADYLGLGTLFSYFNNSTNTNSEDAEQSGKRAGSTTSSTTSQRSNYKAKQQQQQNHFTNNNGSTLFSVRSSSWTGPLSIGGGDNHSNNTGGNGMPSLDSNTHNNGNGNGFINNSGGGAGGGVGVVVRRDLCKEGDGTRGLWEPLFRVFDEMGPPPPPPTPSLSSELPPPPSETKNQNHSQDHPDFNNPNSSPSSSIVHEWASSLLLQGGQGKCGGAADAGGASAGAVGDGDGGRGGGQHRCGNVDAAGATLVQLVIQHYYLDRHSRRQSKKQHSMALQAVMAAFQRTFFFSYGTCQRFPCKRQQQLTSMSMASDEQYSTFFLRRAPPAAQKEKKKKKDELSRTDEETTTAAASSAPLQASPPPPPFPPSSQTDGLSFASNYTYAPSSIHSSHNPSLVDADAVATAAATAAATATATATARPRPNRQEIQQQQQQQQRKTARRTDVVPTTNTNSRNDSSTVLSWCDLNRMCFTEAGEARTRLETSSFPCIHNSFPSAPLSLCQPTTVFTRTASTGARHGDGGGGNGGIRSPFGYYNYYPVGCSSGEMSLGGGSGGFGGGGGGINSSPLAGLGGCSGSVYQNNDMMCRTEKALLDVINFGNSIKLRLLPVVHSACVAVTEYDASSLSFDDGVDGLNHHDAFMMASGVRRSRSHCRCITCEFEKLDKVVAAATAAAIGHSAGESSKQLELEEALDENLVVERGKHNKGKREKISSSKKTTKQRRWHDHDAGNNVAAVRAERCRLWEMIHCGRCIESPEAELSRLILDKLLAPLTVPLLLHSITVAVSPQLTSFSGALRCIAGALSRSSRSRVPNPNHRSPRLTSSSVSSSTPRPSTAFEKSRNLLSLFFAQTALARLLGNIKSAHTSSYKLDKSRRSLLKRSLQRSRRQLHSLIYPPSATTADAAEAANIHNMTTNHSHTHSSSHKSQSNSNLASSIQSFIILIVDVCRSLAEKLHEALTTAFPTVRRTNTTSCGHPLFSYCDPLDDVTETATSSISASSSDAADMSGRDDDSTTLLCRRIKAVTETALGLYRMAVSIHQVCTTVVLPPADGEEEKEEEEQQQNHHLLSSDLLSIFQRTLRLAVFMSTGCGVAGVGVGGERLVTWLHLLWRFCGAGRADRGMSVPECPHGHACVVSPDGGGAEQQSSSSPPTPSGDQRLSFVQKTALHVASVAGGQQATRRNTFTDGPLALPAAPLWLDLSPYGDWAMSALSAAVTELTHMYAVRSSACCGAAIFTSSSSASTEGDQHLVGTEGGPADHGADYDHGYAVTSLPDLQTAFIDLFYGCLPQSLYGLLQEGGSTEAKSEGGGGGGGGGASREQGKVEEDVRPAAVSSSLSSSCVPPVHWMNTYKRISRRRLVSFIVGADESSVYEYGLPTTTDPYGDVAASQGGRSSRDGGGRLLHGLLDALDAQEHYYEEEDARLTVIEDRVALAAVDWAYGELISLQQQIGGRSSSGATTSNSNDNNKSGRGSRSSAAEAAAAEATFSSSTATTTKRAVMEDVEKEKEEGEMKTEKYAQEVLASTVIPTTAQQQKDRASAGSLSASSSTSVVLSSQLAEVYSSPAAAAKRLRPLARCVALLFPGVRLQVDVTRVGGSGSSSRTGGGEGGGGTTPAHHHTGRRTDESSDSDTETDDHSSSSDSSDDSSDSDRDRNEEHNEPTTAKVGWGHREKIDDAVSELHELLNDEGGRHENDAGRGGGGNDDDVFPRQQHKHEGILVSLTLVCWRRTGSRIPLSSSSPLSALPPLLLEQALLAWRTHRRRIHSDSRRM